MASIIEIENHQNSQKQLVSYMNIAMKDLIQSKKNGTAEQNNILIRNQSLKKTGTIRKAKVENLQIAPLPIIR
jgi:hypothetical protein